MEQTPKDFTLDDKNESMSSSEKILISYRDTSYKFHSGSYKEEILGNLISKTDYDNIVSQASKLM